MAGTYFKTAERGQGQHQPIVRPQTRPEHRQIHDSSLQNLLRQCDKSVKVLENVLCVPSPLSLRRSEPSAHVAEYKRHPILADTNANIGGYTRYLPPYARCRTFPYTTYSDTSSLQRTYVDAKSTDTAARLKHLPSRTRARRDTARCNLLRLETMS
jgi:hypothetical protein